MTVQLSNSKIASKSACVACGSETQDPDPGGIYIGRTSIYRQPVFLNTDALVNPHISIVGMTGSGKTFLLRSLVSRYCIYAEHNIIVIDWNGEYSQAMLLYGGIEHIVCSKGGRPSCKIQYPELQKLEGRKSNKGVAVSFNLSRLADQNQKSKKAREIIRFVVAQLPKHRIVNAVRNILVLDEAWKLLSYKELGVLFREGRKYGFSAVLATQMAKDIANEVISNCACILVFKLQNDSDFDLLERSEVITKADIKTISILPVGSCLAIQKYRGGNDGFRKVVIEQVQGVEFPESITFKDDKMELEIEVKRFIELTGGLFPAQGIRSPILEFVERNENRISITNFIRFLMGIGVSRPEVVTYLRVIGISDDTIIAAYASASKFAVKREASVWQNKNSS